MLERSTVCFPGIMLRAHLDAEAVCNVNFGSLHGVMDHIVLCMRQFYACIPVITISVASNFCRENTLALEQN